MIYMIKRLTELVILFVICVCTEAARVISRAAILMLVMSLKDQPMISSISSPLTSV